MTALRMSLFSTSVVMLATIVGLAIAQEAKSEDPPLAPGGIYRSDTDELVTIRSITLLPVTDNMNGVYGGPLGEHLRDLIKDRHQWDFYEIQEGTTPTTDASLNLRIEKGPKGLTLRLSLVLARDQLLFAQAEIKNETAFAMAGLKKSVEALFRQILSRIPYDGLILSRDGTRVTINLGRRDKVEPNQIVTAVQVVKLNRHPKFHFVINAEKEIIGRIRLVKVDEKLSFGRIISEKENGAIQKNAKIGGIDFVSLPENDNLTPNAPPIADPVAFGQQPEPWVPIRPPSFGSVSARLGFGDFRASESATSIGSKTAADPFYPFLALDLELWLMPMWNVHFNLRQGILSTKNPLSGSSPEDLAYSMSAYEFLAGYNLRLGADIWGPAIELLAGYTSYKNQVDESSPVVFSSLTYSGFKFGVKGTYPVSEDRKLSLGSQLLFVLSPRLSANPAASGSADNTVNEFQIFATYKLQENLKAIAALDVDLYSSTFSGGTSQSASRRHTMLSGGLTYLF